MHTGYIQSVRLAGRIDGGRPIESFVCGSRNRLTGLGLSGVCAPPADGLSWLFTFLHNVHKGTYKMYACMHAGTHVRDAGMWIE